MKTVKCNDCKKQVSLTADTCPHCGSYSPTKVTDYSLMIGFFLILGFVVYIWVSFK